MSSGKADGKWDDLGPRLATAVAMVAVGSAAIWAGGLWFAALAVLACGVMTWELANMIRPGHENAARQEGALAALALAISIFIPISVMLIVLFLLLIVLIGRTGREPLRTGLAAAVIFLACYALVDLRGGPQGLRNTVLLVGLVVVTDIAGYFAGRIIGGPKFWPRISPKKTWAGVLAGWLAAGLLFAVSVALFEQRTGFSADFSSMQVAGGFLIGMMVSFASQMGDIAESAIKRHFKVKDSSALLPGHGGMLDRFDAMMGAALFVSLLGVFSW